MKKFLFQGMIGIFFGAFIAVVATNIVYMSGIEVLDGSIFLKNSLGSIFFGLVFSVTPLYFEMKTLRLPMQTALHFVTVTILYFILSIGIGWVPFEMKSLLLFVGLFIIIYAVIWVSFYLYFKNEAKKLNDELQHI
jgi:hypothetical protein